MEGGPPGFTQDCTCPTLLGIPLGVVRVDLPGYHRLWRAVPGRFGLASYSHGAVPQPRRCKHPRFGLAPVRSPLLRGSRLLSLPPGTEMFQFPGFPLPALCVQAGVTRHYPCRVSPFGDPRVQRLVGSSPRLIAASYVLHRLLVPRHPPCALTSLATKMLASTVQFSSYGRDCARGRRLLRTNCVRRGSARTVPAATTARTSSRPGGGRRTGRRGWPRGAVAHVGDVPSGPNSVPTAGRDLSPFHARTRAVPGIQKSSRSNWSAFHP